jgi:RNA polymerase sigma factor (sigma-70 family)
MGDLAHSVKKDIQAIWRGVQAEDPDAWRRLVRLYAGLVNSVARRAGLSVPDAEDCAQQTWLALYRRRRAIKDPVALPLWLMRTTQRRAVQMARRLAHETTLEKFEEVRDPQLPADEALSKLEAERYLRRALRKLDPRCRRLINSLFLSERRKSYQEIARVLGVKPNSFGPLRSRCLAQLRAVLKNMGYDSD